MRSHPLVTIGVASFNNARYIRALLDSIRAQTHPAIQLIISDDCSTDNSVAIIREWMQEMEYPAVFRQSSHNQGIVAGINAMLTLAEGDFVLWIGSDDWLAPTMIADTLAEFERRGPSCGAVYSDCTIIDSEGQESAPSFLRYFNPQFVPPQGNLVVALLRGFYLPTVTTVVRRALLEQVGPYDETLLSEDLDMWLRLSRHNAFAYLPKVTAAYRVHAHSMTKRFRTRLNETFFRIYRKGYFQGEAEWEAARHSLINHAEHYYLSKGPNARQELWFAWRETHQPKMLLFLLLAVLGTDHHRLLGRG